MHPRGVGLLPGDIVCITDDNQSMLSLSLQCVKTAIVLVVALGSATSGNEIVCPDDISQITALDHAGVDWDAVPILGVAHHRHLCNDAAAGDLPLRCSVGDTVVNALEADEQVTGVCVRAALCFFVCVRVGKVMVFASPLRITTSGARYRAVAIFESSSKFANVLLKPPSIHDVAWPFSQDDGEW